MSLLLLLDQRTPNTLAPAGVVSGQDFGSTTLTVGAVDLAPAAIASGEAVGLATLVPGVVLVAPAGITGGAFGVPTLTTTVDVGPAGAQSTETFGTSTIAVTVGPVPVATGEAFGAAALLPGPVTVSATGAGSSEAFGSAVARWARAENTFEGGAAGTPISTGGTGSGTAWDATSVGDAGSATWDATRSSHGFLSGRFLTTGSDVAYVMWTSVVSAPTVWARCYLYLDAYPPGNTNVLRLMSGASTIVGTVRVNSAGQVGYFTGSSFRTSTSAPITLGRWVRIEARYTASTTAGSATIRVYDNLDPDSTVLTEELSSTGVNTASNSDIDRLRAGIVAAATVPDGLWIDDVAWSDVGWLGPATGTKVLIPTAVAPAGQFGTPALTAGAVTVTPAAIVSAETHGTGALSSVVTVTTQSAASAEAVGGPTVTTGAVTLGAAGVAGAEAVGTPTVATGPVTVAPAAIVSAETHGTGALSSGPVVVAAAEVASAEAFGAPAIVPGGVMLAPAGVETAFGAGEPALTVQSLDPYLHNGQLVIPLQAGLSGTESESLYALSGSRVETQVAQLPNPGNGTTTMMLRFAAAGGVDELSIAWRGDGTIAFTAITAGVTDETTIAYDAAWTRWRISESGGTVGFAVSATGITWTTHKTVPMPDWTGAGRIALLAGYSGAETDPGQARFEAVNPPLVVQTITPAGIGSAEAHGTAEITTGAVTVAPAGVETAEAFGEPTATAGVVLLVPPAIASGEEFGAASLSTGPVQVLTPGIDSAQAFGDPAVVAGPLGLHPSGIGSAEAAGDPAVSVGQANIVPIDIASAEAFGTAAFDVTGVPIHVVGADSAEVFGTATLGLFLLPSSIETAETVPAVRVGGKYVDAEPITSAEAFGATTLLWTPSSGDLPDGGRVRTGGQLVGRVAVAGRSTGRTALSGGATGGRVAVGASPAGRSQTHGNEPGRLSPARR